MGLQQRQQPKVAVDKAVIIAETSGAVAQSAAALFHSLLATMAPSILHSFVKLFANHNPSRLFALLIFFMAGCSGSNHDTPAKDKDAFASPSNLTAVFTNGNNVLLNWKNNATVDGGNWVEYTQPGYDYIKLQAFGSDAEVTSFLHPDLAPQTKLIYHIQPFFGRPTKPIAITTGINTNNAPMLSDGPIRETNSVSVSGNEPRCSLRDRETFADATPSDLTASLSSPTSVDLHWKNHASDEDGYLLEISAQPEGDFSACALLPPGANSFRKTSLPSETKCYFRVRAFFYGRPTEPVSLKTPAR